jgi:peptidyl-tRNA hydrolase, PTH1 family
MFFRKKTPQMDPEWMVVGLGNPGAEYRGTRHNVGFEVVDRLAKEHRIKMGSGRHRAMIGVGQIGGTPVLLVKPLTYMNLSGQSVAPLAQQYNIKPERILVVADDLDMKVGRVRLKPKGSAGGHNGHKSLIALLRTQDYPRLKIGIGSASGATVDHVLSPFDRDERPIIEEALDGAMKGVEAVVQQGLERGMNVVNEGPKEKDEG